MLNIEANALFAAAGAYLLSMVSYLVLVSFRNDKFGKAGTWFLYLGFILQTVSIAARTYAAGRLPFANLYESMISFTWGIALSYIIIERQSKNQLIGALALPVIFMASLYASTMNKAIEPLMPALQSNWLLAHVGVAVISYGVFAISFGTAILYLVKDDERFDDLTYRLIAFAFPFLTLVVITGAVWAEQAWGTYWSWDPKETWSLITWLIYLAYLHTRLVLGWKGRVSAWFAVLGFLAVIFTYLGVSFLLSGLHSYT